jgi:hypothetical protein
MSDMPTFTPPRVAISWELFTSIATDLERAGDAYDVNSTEDWDEDGSLRILNIIHPFLRCNLRYLPNSSELLMDTSK